MSKSNPWEPIRFVPSYKGYSDGRPGKFRLYNPPTETLVIVEGTSLAQAVELLRWDPKQVLWVHLGSTKETSLQVYLVRGVLPPHLRLVK